MPAQQYFTTESNYDITLNSLTFQAPRLLKVTTIMKCFNKQNTEFDRFFCSIQKGTLKKKIFFCVPVI